MTRPDLNDTDRLIAATREEAGKTRRLLISIFVGLPVLGLIIWGLVAASSTPSPSTSSDSSVVTSTAGSTGPLSLYSLCQSLNDASTDQLHDFDEGWPEVADEAAINCAAHPDWTISEAIVPLPTNGS